MKLTYRSRLFYIKILLTLVSLIFVSYSLVNYSNDPAGFALLLFLFFLSGTFLIYIHKSLTVRIINSVNENQRTVSQFFPVIDAKRKTVDGTKIFSLTEKYGSPVFVVSRERLLKKLKSIKITMNSKNIRYKIAYSIKTNNVLFLSKMFRQNGLLAEVASGSEYAIAKKAGFPAKHIIFNGPYKSKTDLTTAIKEKALIIIDNFEEIELISSLVKKEIKIGIRINTGVFGKSRFGFSINNGNAINAARILSKNKYLKLTTVHFNLGSNIPSPVFFKNATGKALQLIDDLKKINIRIQTLDIGGGFPTIGSGVYSSIIPYSFDEYITAVTGEINSRKNTNLNLVIEPGRLLTDESMVLLTTVTSVKNKNTTQEVTVDGSINIFPLSNRYQLILVVPKKILKNKLYNTNVYGASCMENDILIKNRQIEKLNEGDVLVLFNAGAYNISQSKQFIFGRPSVVKIEEGKVSILRKREKSQDFYRLDL